MANISLISLEEYNAKKEIYKYGIGKLYEGKVDNPAIPAGSEGIFDTNSNNYHLYPKENLAEYIKLYVKKYGDLKGAVTKLAEEGVIAAAKSWKDFDSYDGDQICVWTGSNGTLKTADNTRNIFYFISAQKNDVVYELNLMRFFISKDNHVNCILRQFQYDRVIEKKKEKEKPSERRLNAGKVCYPTTYKGQSKETLKKLVEKNAGNFCYNPQVTWDDDPEKIVRDFIEFINVCEAESGSFIEKI